MFKINSKEMLTDSSFRFDEKYVKNQMKAKEDFYSFSDLFSIIQDNKIDSDDIEGTFDYCQIGDTDSFGNVYPVQLNFEEKFIEDEPYYKKIEKNDIINPKEGDILISKIRPNLKKIIYIDKNKKDIYFTKAFLHLRAKKESLICYFLLRIYLIDDINAVTRLGKGYPVINEKDIVNVKISKRLADKLFLNKDTINKFINKNIEFFEKNKNDFSEQSIIDKEFNEIFHYDILKFEELKNESVISRSSKYMAINPDIRISSKFNRRAAQYVEHELKKIPYRKLSDCISEPIIQGVTIREKNYDFGTDLKYLTMGTFKTWRVDLEGLKEVDEIYYKAAKKANKKLNVGDIVFARSGEGTIGKVAIFMEENEEVVFSDFVLRIRVSELYNPKFIYYYFRTCYFQYLVEVYKKGLGNNTNIFPSALNKFPIPIYDIVNQKKIVDKLDYVLEIRKNNIMEMKNFDNKLKEYITSL